MARLACGGGRFARGLQGAQGLYYVTTGVWPLLHMRSFLAVTGPKTDLWLVQTVGALITIIGGTLLGHSLRRGGVTLSDLAIGSASALAAVDVVFVAQRRIPPVYLLDAALEIVLAGGWVAARRARAAAAQAGVSAGAAARIETPSASR